MAFDRYIHLCNPHYTHDMEYFHQARMFLIAHLLKGATDLFTVKEATDLLTVTTD